MKRSRLFIALCVMLSICFLIPTFAFAGSDHYDSINYSLGVRTVCDGYSCSTYGNGRIRLSFVDGVNHMLEEDYSCKIRVEASVISPNPGIGSVESETLFITTMDLSLRVNRPNGNYTVTSVVYKCYVNNMNNEIRNKTIPV